MLAGVLKCNRRLWQSMPTGPGQGPWAALFGAAEKLTTDYGEAADDVKIEASGR